MSFTVIALVWQIAQWANPLWQGPTFQPWMLLTAGVLLLGRASYLAWLDEHRLRVEAEARVTKDAPDFTGYVNPMAFEDPVDGISKAYLLVSVENTGSRASILHNWGMYYQKPGALDAEVPSRHPKHGEDVVISTDETRSQLLINADQFIAAKSYPNGIEPGHGCRGFLRCDLPEALPDGTVFKVTFRDYNKRIYACEYNTSIRRQRMDDVGEIGGWPGVEIKHGRITLA